MNFLLVFPQGGNKMAENIVRKVWLVVVGVAGSIDE